ncbi:potassium voltage-gated channel subfamily H member 8-like [Mercenaria mercenaria]|uniref:potassium voltage-gated channel subfamily H member 8-like n=1 Tax=Mercenaria mercenaria TaxID=6596 RepID=UPI00234EBDAE|nr:potassium voltage-gated channel subfamily H member 8-like [Mercenaria mercenaria]XP_053386350.1 potassium voltage-gated channel subfamily H member 8-like [Mercenaria mercenaria]
MQCVQIYMLIQCYVKHRRGFEIILWKFVKFGFKIKMKKGLLAPQNTFLDTIATRFDGTHSNFVLGNAQASGCPVVYCSDGFCELTGFPRSQVMGRSCACKFLFGDETLVDEKGKIEDALENKTELKTELFFYKKDGDRFKCLLDIVPIKNEKSQVVLILVSHKDVGDKTEKGEDTEGEKTSSDEPDSDEEMAEAYRRCQARRGRSTAALPGTAGYSNQRRRSRAVLYHLSGQFEKHNRANRAKTKLQQLNKFSSMSAKMPEYKVQEVKKSKFILIHYGIFKIGWDWLILLCTFYTAILVPYNAAFTRGENNRRDSIHSDVVVEILFMFDILFNFRTSFVNKSGQVVYEARLIALNYIKGWFLLDLLAAIPFDFLYVFNINTEAPVHLLKVARLIRLARLLQKIDRFSQYSALVLALLMSMFTLLAHWLACAWYAIGNVEFEHHTTAGWLYELSERLDLNRHVGNNSSDNETVKPDIMMSYLSALYFTCSSLTSVGFGNVSANTNSEKIFSICAMIIGALMHAVVFGNVTALIQRMYQRRANFHSKTKDLKDFFRAYDIPKPLKQRMQEYFQTMWSINNGIESNEILKDFPEEMKGELGLHLHKEVLNLPIFEEATQGCLRSIALHTRRSFCAPGEFLVHKGDASNYLYLLVSGSMEILKMDMVVAILGKGDLFGSDIDFNDPISVCNYDVRSLTYSELQCINLKGLTDVLLLYPDFAEKFAKDIHNDLTYNLRQTGEEDSDEETTSSPKTRVCTLPSISEDDELSPSDDEDEEEKEKPTEEDDMEPPFSSQSVSSPLLPPPGRLFQKLPNGDIAVDSLNSPPSIRPWGIRRTSGLLNRQSIKETRKLRLGHQPETIDKIIPHVQNLQNEVEGTKAAISKLERKVTRIGQNISSIDRNMREILKHLTNASKMSPLESLAPASPCTPCPSSTHFNFDFQNSTVKHEAKQGSAREKLRETKSDDRVLLHVQSECGNQDDLSERREEFNPRRRSSLQVPLLLNPHELVGRRHSDGNKKKNIRNQFQIGMPISKSEYNVRENERTGYKETDRLLDNSDDVSFTESDLTGSYGNITDNVLQTDIERENASIAEKSDDGLNFMGRLEEVHSDTCKSPLELRRIVEVCDNDTVCDKDAIRKSSTFDTFKVTPKLTLNKDQSMPALKLHLPDRPKYSDRNDLFCNDKTGIFLETLQSSRKSKSCVEISPKPKRSDMSAKAKSYDILETEFGARTPNEVRTIHVRTKCDSHNGFTTSRGTSDLGKKSIEMTNDRICPNEICPPIKEVETCTSSVWFNGGKDLHLSCPSESSVKENHTCYEDTHTEIVLDNSRADSGHVSLIETVQSDLEKKEKRHREQNTLTKHAEFIDTDDKLSPISLVNSHEKLRRLKPDVSPDSLTDISESLITDSVKTEDETVIDIDSEVTVINNIYGPLVDTSVVKTTDL